MALENARRVRLSATISRIVLAAGRALMVAVSGWGMYRCRAESFQSSSARILGSGIDFQTVTGSPLRNAEGKPKSTGNTIISNRTYLQDACFTVVLETDPVWKEKILAALKEPKWCMYLGRKNCVPSRPILEREEVAFFDLEEAIRCYPPSERADVGMVFETEKESSAMASYTRPDRLLPGGRRYASRRVWRGITKEEPNVSV